MELKEYLRAEVYGNADGMGEKLYLKYKNPSTNAVYLIRIMQYYWNRGTVLSKRKAINIGNKLIKKYGIFIPPQVKIGRGLKLPHPNGIIIGSCAEIGEDCTIFQQVTIGSNLPGDFLNGKQPKIGNGVWLFAGCKVIGDIYVADNTLVGANAVLRQNTRSGYSYVGIPAHCTEVKHSRLIY